MVEVDVKSELENQNKELRQLVIKLVDLDRQRQAAADNILKTKGAIEVLQRLNTKKAS